MDLELEGDTDVVKQWDDTHLAGADVCGAHTKCAMRNGNGTGLPERERVQTHYDRGGFMCLQNGNLDKIRLTIRG